MDDLKFIMEIIFIKKRKERRVGKIFFLHPFLVRKREKEKNAPFLSKRIGKKKEKERGRKKKGIKQKKKGDNTKKEEVKKENWMKETETEWEKIEEEKWCFTMWMRMEKGERKVKGG